VATLGISSCVGCAAGSLRLQCGSKRRGVRAVPAQSVHVSGGRGWIRDMYIPSAARELRVSYYLHDKLRLLVISGCLIKNPSYHMPDRNERRKAMTFGYHENGCTKASPFNNVRSVKADTINIFQAFDYSIGFSLSLSLAPGCLRMSG
jgi:hypothetical protein